MSEFNKGNKTHSTLEDKRYHFWGRPWYFTRSPKGNILPDGRYRVRNGRLEKVEDEAPASAKCPPNLD